MAQDRTLSHLDVSQFVKPVAYRRPKMNVDSDNAWRPQNPVAHAEKLLHDFDAAVASGSAHAGDGIDLEFSVNPDSKVSVTSLEDLNKQIRVRLAREQEGEIRAIVHYPERHRLAFRDKIELYASDEQTPAGNRKQANAVEPVNAVASPSIGSFWNDPYDTSSPSIEERRWLEVWIDVSASRRDEISSYMQRDAASNVGEMIVYRDRAVLLVHSSLAAIEQDSFLRSRLSEIRNATLVNPLILDGYSDKVFWADVLAEHIVEPGDGAPVVCVLDTGVFSAHPILRPFMDQERDAFAAKSGWTTADDSQAHGTAMVGIAALGDLAPIMRADTDIVMTHGIESVRILPPGGEEQDRPALYPRIMANAVAKPEAANAERRRVFSMAVANKEPGKDGSPSSWSVAIDALSFGRSIDVEDVDKRIVYLDDPLEAGKKAHSRLILVCAGNVGLPPSIERDKESYLVWCDEEPIHDPGQAWNALTVGAHTERAVVNDEDFEALAPLGQLSPHSSTSREFDPRWPIKPEILVEGGNAAIRASGEIQSSHDDLSILTLGNPLRQPLNTSAGTSIAVSEAARYAAILMADYPELWPTSIRALLVHTAEWTDVMNATLPAKPNKGDMVKLARRYGYGVASLDRARRSARNAVVLIGQQSIAPYKRSDSGIVLGDMDLWKLPWPTAELRALNEATVTVKTTLSYFVEPNLGERAWQTRYRYASCGLRFALKGPTETTEQFSQRINEAARIDAGIEGSPTQDEHDWAFGVKGRDKGSIHVDWVSKSAAELADCGEIAVFPVGGWWKEQRTTKPWARQVPYTIVVSISAPDSDVDLYSSIESKIPASSGIETSIDIDT